MAGQKRTAGSLALDRLPLPIAPFLAGHGINTPDAKAYPEWYDWTPYTWPFNAAKLPAASCPWGLDAAGLPQAVQLAATHFREDLVLRGSAILEKARPYSRRDWPQAQQSCP